MIRARDNTREPLDILIEGWGRMGTYWGVGKVMAEIQALLYLSTRPLSLEEMSERLKISRSNISLNVRGLQDLGVVRKIIIPGDRKDYYAAEEDVAKVARRLAGEKKRRELDPALRIVRDAINAAGTATKVEIPSRPVAGPTRTTTGSDDTGPPLCIDTHRLHKLKHLMEMIADIFDSFIEEEGSEVRPATPARSSQL